MDNKQIRIIELLREANVVAVQEIGRLQRRLAELETQSKPKHEVVIAPAGLLNEHQVARYLRMSVATLRRRRFLRQGPKFVKIGACVRYRMGDLESWLSASEDGLV